MSSAEAAPATPEAPAGPKESKLPLILGILNSVVVLGAVGTLAYTRLLYKRPPILEDAERERITSLYSNPSPATIPTVVNFEPVTVNIQSTPDHPRPDGSNPGQIEGKLHYATVGFSLEIADQRRQEQVETIRPKIMDKLLSILGHKHFHELTTVEGRYVLRNQLMDTVNQLVLNVPLHPVGEGGSAKAESHEGGGEGGEGGGHEGKAASKPAPAQKLGPVDLKAPLVTDVYFTQFIVQ